MKVNKFNQKSVNFVFVDENTETEYRFNNLKCTEEEFLNWLEEKGDYDDLETKYGVHDYSGGEDDKEIVVGFTSYEISKSDFQIVMEIWRQKLLSAGFINENQKVEVVEGNNSPTIVIYNIPNDYTEVYEIETISPEIFEEDYDDDLQEFVEDELGEDYGIYEYDGNQGENDYLIQTDYEDDDWEKVFNKIVKKIKKFFEKNHLTLKKINLDE